MLLCLHGIHHQKESNTLDLVGIECGFILNIMAKYWEYNDGDVMMDIFIKPGFAGDSVIFVVNPPCLKVLKSTGTLLGAILSRRFEGIAGGKAWPQLSTWIQDLGETTRHLWW
jgi:hypothetical protein